MAVVTLTKLFVNLLSTGEYVAAQSNARQAQYVDLVEVKRLAGGRLRAVSVVGEEGTFGFTMLDVPVADVDKLRLWKGQTVQVRDDRGRVFLGAYSTVDTGDVGDKKTSYNVTLTVKTVTAPEGV